MRKKLSDALSEISDEKIAEAAVPPRRVRLPYRLGAMAAALALVMLAAFSAMDRGEAPGTVTDPTNVRLQQPTTQPQATAPAPSIQAPAPSQGTEVTQPSAPVVTPLSCVIVQPDYPEMVLCPNLEDYENYSDYAAAEWAWWTSRRLQYNQPAGYADSLERYFQEAIPAFLESDGENTICSPVNIYMALAMLAETTDGTSRQQILDLLGADSMEALRTQAGYVWNAHYSDDGVSTTLLGSSLWLDEACTYNQHVVNTLADSYYASVFWGDLGSEEINQDLQTWLNENTRGLLSDQTQNVQLDPSTVLALAATIYYQANWADQFYEGSTITDTFHGPGGNVDCDFMRNVYQADYYYYGEDFGAVRLSLGDGSSMWLILPDEGLTPDDLLKTGNALEMVMTGSGWTDKVTRKIHLSLPKFDVVADFSLNDSLEKLGITDVFDRMKADFSAIAPTGFDGNIYLGKVQHAARVKIDEEGVEAAAYTVMPTYGDGMTPELEEINFVLDRPFLFVITSHDNLPLFAGSVYQP